MSIRYSATANVGIPNKTNQIRNHTGLCNADSIFTEIHFITSKKGYQLLVYQQYTYAKNSESRKGISWTCSSRCSRKCNAQVFVTNASELIVVNAAHSHNPPVFYTNGKGEYIRVSERKLEKMHIVRAEDLYDSIDIEENSVTGDVKTEYE